MPAQSIALRLLCAGSGTGGAGPSPRGMQPAKPSMQATSKPLPPSLRIIVLPWEK
jgi:hypothetical protein